MSTVLFLPRNGTSWSKMRPQYRLVEAQTDWTPVVVLADAAMIAMRSQLASDGIRFVEVPACRQQDRGHFPILERLWRRLSSSFPPLARVEPLLRHDRVAHALPVALLRSAVTRTWLRRDYRALRDCFAKLDPFALLMPGDRELGSVQPALKAARDLGLVSVITVSNVPSIPSHSAQRRGQPRFLARPRDAAPLLNLLAAWRLPGQVADTPDGRLLFSPGWLTLAFAREGMLGRNPWCQGGGQSDYILLDGPRKERIYTALGVPQEKIRTLGDITQDPVHRGLSRRAELRASLAARYGLDAGKPFYLFAVPIYGEHDLMPWPDHLAALERAMAVLAQRPEEVLLSLHPRSRREAYIEMAARHGLPVAEETAAEIIAAADLWICGSSSTIEWAVLCGIPAINLDYAGLEDPAWDQYPGVVRCGHADALDEALVRFAEEPDWRASLAAAQRDSARDFARFDGRAGERFLEFLAQLEAAKGKAPVTGASTAVERPAGFEVVAQS